MTGAPSETGPRMRSLRCFAAAGLMAGALLVGCGEPLAGQSPDEVLDSLSAAVNRADFDAVDSLFAPRASIHYEVPFGLNEPRTPGWLSRPSDLYRSFGFNVATVSVRTLERMTTARWASEHVRVEFRDPEEEVPFVWHYFATYQFDGRRIWRLWKSPPEPDSSSVPPVSSPTFGDDGPLVVFDGAHGNRDLPSGTHWSLREALRRDGLRVRTAYGGLEEALGPSTDVFVIMNALTPADREDRALPVASAFTPDEVAAIVDWVRAGGGLLLVADHMPWPGAVADLARELGVDLLNGYAVAEPRQYPDVFSREDGSLRSHPITNGREASERVRAVGTFGGSGFRAAGLDPLLVLPDEMVLFEPNRWPEVNDSTPRRPAGGLLQGAAGELGDGRVVILGEVAMLRILTPAAAPSVKGLDNGRFALNLFRWLGGAM